MTVNKESLFALLIILLTAMAADVWFDQKLYSAFVGDMVTLHLNFSDDLDPRLALSYERFELAIGARIVMTCTRPPPHLKLECSTSSDYYHVGEPVLTRDSLMSIRVDNVSPNLGSTVLATFYLAGSRHEASTNIVVLEEPICNATYREVIEEGGKRRVNNVPVLEETELNENEAVTVYCSVDTYHREGDVAVRASWKSSSAILLKVTNRVKGVHPLTASQTALFAVNRISRFDSLFCEVEVPICVPGQVGCSIAFNITQEPGGDDDEYIDYYEYGEEDTGGLVDFEMASTSTCLSNEKKCRCYLKEPKLTYCADKVDIIEEVLPHGAVKLTCRVVSSPPSNLVWESSDPAFRVSREPTITVTRNALYTCRASIPVNKFIQCDVRSKSIDLTSCKESRFKLRALSLAGILAFGLACLASLCLLAKGVVENNRKVMRQAGPARNFFRSGVIDPLSMSETSSTRPPTIGWGEVTVKYR